MTFVLPIADWMASSSLAKGGTNLPISDLPLLLTRTVYPINAPITEDNELVL